MNWKYIQRRPIQFNKLKFDGLVSNFTGGNSKREVDTLTTPRSGKIICNSKWDIDNLRFTAKIKIPKCLCVENTTMFVNWVDSQLSQESTLYAIDKNGDLIKTEAIMVDYSPQSRQSLYPEYRVDLEFASTSGRWERVDYNNAFFYMGETSNFWQECDSDQNTYMCTKCNHTHAQVTLDDPMCEECGLFISICQLNLRDQIWESCCNDYLIIENCQIAYEKMGNQGVYGKLLQLDEFGRGVFPYFGGTPSEDGRIKIAFDWALSPSIEINGNEVSTEREFNSAGVLHIDTVNSTIYFDDLSGGKLENVIKDFSQTSNPFFTINPVNNRVFLRNFQYPVVNIKFNEYVL